MLKIRLQKIGKKNSPSYRIVLTEHTNPPQGKFIEILGSYNPRKKIKKFNKERIEHLISDGAQPSATVYNLLVDEGIIKGIKIKAWRPKKKNKEELGTETEKTEKIEAKETGKEETKKEQKEEVEEKVEKQEISKEPEKNKEGKELPEQEQPNPVKKEDKQDEEGGEKKNDEIKS